jgi:hypothetical protein
MSKRSKTKNSKATPAVQLRPVVSPVRADVTKLKSKVASVANKAKPIIPANPVPAIKTKVKQPTHALNAALPIEAIEMKLSVPHSSPSTAPKIQEALEAVAAIPEKLATNSVILSKPDPIAEEAPELTPHADPTFSPTPWDYSAKILDIGQANTLCVTNFAQRYAAARSPQDIMSITSDFYKEQGRLFKLHSEAILKMLSF